MPQLETHTLMNRPSRGATMVMTLLVSASICVFFAISSVFADGEQIPLTPFMIDGKVDLIYKCDDLACQATEE